MNTIINNETIEMVIINSSELTLNSDGMPILKLVAGSSVIGYLSPYGLNRFQISKTYDGKLKLGSCPALGIRDILKALDAFGMSPYINHLNIIFRGLIDTAIINAAVSIDYDIEDSIDEFIDATIKYIRSLN